MSGRLTLNALQLAGTVAYLDEHLIKTRYFSPIE